MLCEGVMQNKEQTTQEKILYAAKAEFLEKGFPKASLRTIVKEAGVTTGALYGYYGSKEALFDALVEECYTHFLSAYRNALDDFDRLSVVQRSNSSTRKAMTKSHDRAVYALLADSKWKLDSEKSSSDTGLTEETDIALETGSTEDSGEENSTDNQ